MRVAVVGGGAVGLTAAYDLATRGTDVTVFERGEYDPSSSPAAGSSARAAGVLYDAYAEDIDAEIGGRALERFREFSGEDGFEFRECPYVIAVGEGDETAAGAMAASVDRMRAHGRAVSVVDPEELGDRFPIRTDDLLAAAVAENAGWTDPASYVSAMATKARREGVSFETGAEVALGVNPPNVVDDRVTKRFDAVLVAAGAHTKRVLADAGVSVPLKPYRVQALTGRRRYDGPMVYDATAGVYLRPHPTGILAGDGTVPVEADPDEWNRDADDWFVDDIRLALDERTGYDLDVERAWAGLCTATPDSDPLLGELSEGVFVAAGWQGHGFMRAPATGEAVARQILGESEGLAPFDPARFSGDEEFEIREGMALD
ncbi:FAD-binding oxidoreductase [Haloprofundus sp. MHR1]|uniref:NAD(P)/FAD-dependent oxidoreductase n=1 Tax=Haloprofundus sp. MHR1 TaxID=2572921 RepID=UPI0010BEA8C6|nr:FAD-dependent oxidoreductase [Haloprofundus sp. MHR1]QCJ47554.1 FAD-binding oxidoreductase [Haloprofundus sp. MHR1]